MEIHTLSSLVMIHANKDNLQQYALDASWDFAFMRWIYSELCLPRVANNVDEALKR